MNSTALIRGVRTRSEGVSKVMKQFPVLAVLSSEKRTRRSNATQSNTSYNNIARSRLSLRTAKKSIVYCNGEFLNECCSPIARVFRTGFEFILRVANGPIPLSLSLSLNFPCCLWLCVHCASYVFTVLPQRIVIFFFAKLRHSLEMRASSF